MMTTWASLRSPLAVSTMALLSAGCGGGNAAPKDPYTEAFERCMRYGGNAMICETVARTQAGPQQQGNSDAQWAELEKAATDRARSAGATDIAPAVRLSKVGFAVEHRFELEAGRCYDAAIAWRGGWKTYAAAMYVAGEGGKPPNENLAGRTPQLDPPAGVVHVCADNKGAVNLSLSGIGSNGAVLNNERLEYVLVVGARTETPEETAARRKAEAAAAEEGRARIEANLFNAEQDKGGEALARGCSRCRAVHKECVAEEKSKAGGAPLDEAQGKRCTLRFETCAQALGMDSRGGLSCGYPP